MRTKRCIEQRKPGAIASQNNSITHASFFREGKMTRSYKLVPLNDATPGMVLSDNLTDRYGKVLLPEGTMLTDKLLESLRRYEMDMVPVFCEQLTEAERAEQIMQLRERLNKLFRRHNYDDTGQTANEVLLQYMIKFRQGE
jgi:hypothetical protein